ncbi:LrgB family protein [Neisseriaceae bacterium CLB008]|nr:LrgB family protein [Neisseriaceae bacterium]
MNKPESMWLYLTQSPLLGLTITLAAYMLAMFLHRKSRFHPLVNPVALTVGMVSLFLVSNNVPYDRYFDSAKFIHFLLGPATVALAVPLALQIKKIQDYFKPFMVGLVAGCLTSIVSAGFLMALLGGSKVLVATMTAKAVTTPIAIAVTEQFGSEPSISTLVVLTTGMFGAIMAKYVYQWLNITSDEVKGFALGLNSHGVGTAHAFNINPHMGAFAGLAMGLNGILTTLLLPYMVPMFDWFIR